MVGLKRVSNKNSSLNKEQLQAVKYISGPLLVLAGAGSGKTKVITNKITYLLKECEYKAQNICAVTFTNKAATEMQTRIQKELPANLTRGLKISTFHTLGLNIIKQNLSKLNLRSGFSIFDSEDSLQIIRSFLKSAISQDREIVKQVLRNISLWKNNLLTPNDISDTHENSINGIDIKNIYSNYQETLQSYNAVDFDDLILQPVKIFQQNSAILEEWQNKIRHLLIDEYQDSNSCQYEMVKLLVGVRQRLTAVGDDCQAIYSWRGARPENIINLQKDFPSLKVIKLEQNYRSTARILHSANHLIANNQNVVMKKLWSNLGQGELIRVFTCANEEAEAEQVISDIISHKLYNRTTYNQYAILYRSNHLARTFEKALRNYNISYQISGGQSWFTKTEIKDILAYLKLLSNFDDDAAFLRIINTPKRGIGNKTLTELANYAKQRQQSLFMCCDNIGISEQINDKSIKALKDFKAWFTNIATRLNTSENILEVLKDLLKDIEYEEYLYTQHPTPEKVRRCMDNVWDLLEWLNKIINSKPGLTVSDGVNKLILFDILDNSENENKDAINLMTLHAAKGLEFPYVYLTGVEENILPHHVSIENESIEEERRLTYVGITRAQKNLTLTLSKRRKQGSSLQATTPSRFLDELPKDSLEWYGLKNTENPELSKKIASLHLAGLKSILGQN